jgi:membrane fusion protein (multidrug efflux system)
MSHPHHPHEAKQSSHKKKRILLLLVAPALVGLASLVVYLLGGRYVETDNAYIKAQKVPVSAQVSGAVKEVMVDENQAVKTGQILFRLEQAPFRIAVAKAEAKLHQVRHDLAALKISYHEKQAEISLAKSNYDYALKDQQRQSDLASKNFISAAKLDDVIHNTDVNAQKTALLEEDMKRIAETLGGNPDTPVEQQPAYLTALAELEQARLDFSNTEIRASMAGKVSKPPKVGQFIATGSTAMILVADEVWIEANFNEADLTYVHPGQPVKIGIDTYPDSKLQGMVESLSPATGAEFSLIPAQNATGNWVKIAQRVPVRIRLDVAALPDLRAGLSTWVEIDTGHKRRLFGITL